MSQSGSWVPKGIDQRAREAAREAAVSEGLTLGEYLDRLMNAPKDLQPNEIPRAREGQRPRPESATEALEKLTRRVEATEARSALAIASMDTTIHGLVERLENSQQTTAAIAGHVEGMIGQLRETHDALKAKVRRLEEGDSQQDNLEALKALESALGKLASHVYDENAMAQQESQAIKGRVESGFMDIIERVESMETRVEQGLSETSRLVKEGVEQAALRAAGTARHISERMTDLETEVQERLSGIDGGKERLEAAEARLEAAEADLSGTREAVESRFDQIQDRLSRAETATDSALKNLEASFSSLDERIGDLTNKVDPDLASRLRSEFEARFEDMMKSVRETVDTVRQDLAEEINRAGGASDETVAELKESLGNLQEQVEASDARNAKAVETVSEQVAALNETVDTRLTEVENRSEAAASEAVRDEIDRLGKTVSDRIDQLADDLSQRVNDSESRSAEAIEQIGDQVAAATNRLQMRQNEAIKALAEQVDENRKKADARLSDALANVSERLENMQNQASASLSPVQKAIASLAARLESLEDATLPPSLGAAPTAEFTAADVDAIGADEVEDFLDEPFESFDEFETPEAFDLEDLVTEEEASVEPVLTLPEAKAAQADAADTDAVAFDPEADYSAAEDSESELDEFEAGIDSWNAPTEEEIIDEATMSFEDDFDAIRAAVEGLSFEHHAALGEDMPEPEAEDDAATARATAENDGAPEAVDPLLGLEGLEDDHTEARESDIFDTEEFEPLDLAAVDEATAAATEKPLDSDTADYLSRARRAAMAASGKPSAVPFRASARSGIQLIPSDGAPGNRWPLIAAASAVTIAGLAAGGYLYIRGKQEAPVQAVPADTYVDPGAGDAAPETTTPETEAAISDDAALASMNEDLFGTGETDTALEAYSAQYAPIPDVVTVEAAAASGDYIAQYQLAQDKLAAGDFAAGAELMRKSAQKGLPIAQYALAKLHEKGTGVPKDLTLAREWTEKAARGGNVKAMHDLAVFMAEGDGGEQTYAGAVEWFRKGAEYGVVDSQYNLGVLYEQGLGISPNLTESLFWFDVASRNGDGGAPSKISELIERVSPEAAAQVRSRAAAWQPANANAIANGRFGAQTWNMGNPLQIQAVQKALNALGYDAGTADGIMGGATSQAIRDYQASSRLPVTGTVTSDLIRSLNAGATPA